jgi:hypothetical protein
MCSPQRKRCASEYGEALCDAAEYAFWCVWLVKEKRMEMGWECRRHAAAVNNAQRQARWWQELNLKRKCMAANGQERRDLKELVEGSRQAGLGLLGTSADVHSDVYELAMHIRGAMVAAWEFHKRRPHSGRLRRYLHRCRKSECTLGIWSRSAQPHDRWT